MLVYYKDSEIFYGEILHVIPKVLSCFFGTKKIVFLKFGVSVGDKMAVASRHDAMLLLRINFIIIKIINYSLSIVHCFPPHQHYSRKQTEENYSIDNAEHIFDAEEAKGYYAPPYHGAVAHLDSFAEHCEEQQ